MKKKRKGGQSWPPQHGERNDEDLPAGSYDIALGAIADAFVESPYNRDGYLPHWPLSRTIRAFLTDDTGLNARRFGVNAVFDEVDYDNIHEAIRRRVCPKGDQ